MENYLYDKDITQLNAQNKEIILRKTELRAPYDLIVTKKNIDLGSIVLASQTKLIDVIALDDVKLVLKFDEKYWQKIKVGQTFIYKVDGSDKNYEGKITKIYPIILNETRELQAEVKAKDLMPGLFGNGTIKVD
jgi:multidrug resistance efflux pump